LTAGSFLTFALLIALTILFEKPNMIRYGKKEKAAFFTLTAASAVLAVLLLLFPRLYGPSELIEAFFRPLGKLLD